MTLKKVQMKPSDALTTRTFSVASPSPHKNLYKHVYCINKKKLIPFYFLKLFQQCLPLGLDQQVSKLIKITRQRKWE